MELILAAVGQKFPAWIEQGIRQYQQRMPRHLPLKIQEIATPKRGKNPDVGRLKRIEGDKLMAVGPPSARRIALDRSGKPWSTRRLAENLSSWQMEGRDVVFLIGGPDGLSSDCLGRADQCWSLGPLTLPHGLVRLLLAEQLYRAWSMTVNHPYHRE